MMLPMIVQMNKNNHKRHPIIVINAGSTFCFLIAIPMLTNNLRTIPLKPTAPVTISHNGIVFSPIQLSLFKIPFEILPILAQ
jgi:hypothetical protein